MTTAATSKYSPPEPIPSMPGCSVRPGSARSCHAENAYAAVTPIDTRVSMVDPKCRAFTAAARWNGQAAQLTTGSARAPATQPQFGNWRAGTIEIRKTGTVRAAAATRRGFSFTAGLSAGAPPAAAGSRGARTVAL